MADRERIARQDRDVDRRADRDVRAHRRVQRYERAARGIFKAHARTHEAVEDRLAVLDFADLQERHFRRGRDAVAKRIDHVDRGVLADDLAAEDQRGLDIHAADQSVLRGLALRALRQLAEILGGIEHVLDRAQADHDVRIVHLAARIGEHVLRGRQISGGQDHEHAFARHFQHMQLVVGANVIDTRGRARVGREDEALIDLDGNAVSHGWVRIGARSPVVIGAPIVPDRVIMSGSITCAAKKRHARLVRTRNKGKA